MGECIVTAEFFYSNVSNFAGIWLLSVTVRVDGNPWVLTIYMKKAEIPVGIIIWLAPFRLESFRKYGLSFEMVYF